MSYTTTVHMQGQTRKVAGHTISHSYRDVPDQNGRFVKVGKNSNVDPARTKHNRSYVNDGAGGFKLCTTREEPHAYLERRIEELPNWVEQKGKKVPRGYRKDANLMVETVIQLDPDFTGKSVDVLNDPAKMQEIEEYLTAAVEEITVMYGQENVIGWTVQWDETSPHVQMFSIPVADDGRISQKRFFGGDLGQKSAQAAYQSVHDRVRDRLRSEGYDADMQARRPGAEHIPYRAYGQLQQEKETVAQGAEQVRVSRQQVRAKEQGLTVREQALDDREEELNVKEQQLKERAARQSRNKRWLDREKARLDEERKRIRQEETERARAAADAEFGERLVAASEYWETMKGVVSELNASTRQVVPGKKPEHIRQQLQKGQRAHNAVGDSIRRARLAAEAPEGDDPKPDDDDLDFG